MIRPFELFVGLRYTSARKRSHFISIISLISILGITLGITALITTLSVMNGFGKELRGRILGVISQTQSLHLHHLAHLHTRHHARHHRAHHHAVGHERLRQGTAWPHPRRDLANAVTSSPSSRSSPYSASRSASPRSSPRCRS